MIDNEENDLHKTHSKTKLVGICVFWVEMSGRDREPAGFRIP